MKLPLSISARRREIFRKNWPNDKPVKIRHIVHPRLAARQSRYFYGARFGMNERRLMQLELGIKRAEYTEVPVFHLIYKKDIEIFDL